MVLKWGAGLGTSEYGNQGWLRSHRDSSQIRLSVPSSAGPDQHRAGQGQWGGSGWGRLHPGGLVAAAAAAPNHRSAAGGSPPGPAMGGRQRGEGLHQVRAPLWAAQTQNFSMSGYPSPP